MINIIRNYPAYRNLLWSSITAKLGNSITIVVLMYAIATATNKAIFISLVLLAEMLPMILVGLLAGAIADKYPRYKIMMASEWLQTISVVLMIFSLHNPYLLLILIFLQNIAAAFYTPARSAFISQIVPKEMLSSAIGLTHSIYQVISIVGPALAGVLLFLIDNSSLLIINVITFLLSTLFIYRASKLVKNLEADKPNGQKEPILQSIRYGIKATFEIATLRFLIILIILVMFAAGIFNANSEIISLKLFEVSELHYGLLGAVMGIGGIAGSLLAPYLIKKLPPNKFFIAASVILGCWMIVILPFYLFGSSLQLMLLYVWVFMIGILTAFLNIPINSIFLAITPNEIKGRAVSILQMSVNFAIVIGILVGGILASFISVLSATAIAGVAIIIAAFISMRLKGFKLLNQSESETA